MNLKRNKRQSAVDLPRGSVRVDSVRKRFRKHTRVKKSYSTVKTSFLQRLFGGSSEPQPYVDALAEVSIDVEPGQSVGIIGRNGSGKSSLLKLIAGIYRPDSGKVLVNGKVSALIELGAGFHPDFTGRENVYLGGIMYGLQRSEIDRLFPAIVKFAELEGFIDDPVKTYSSGMYMRLGFSLAVHTDPDILLVDEVLAVGDASFVNRCKQTISDFKRRGKTLILVTHDLESVAQWCDEAIWLDRGVIRKRGEPRPVIDTYLGAVEKEEEEVLEKENKDPAEEIVPSSSEEEEDTRWGNTQVEITSVGFQDKSEKEKWIFRPDDEVKVEVEYQINNAIEELVFGIGLLRADGLCVHGTNTGLEKIDTPLPDFVAEFSGESIKLGQQLPSPLKGKFSISLDRLGLTEGSYFLDVAAHKEDGTPYDYHHRLHKFSVRAKTKTAGVYVPRQSWEFAPQYQCVSEDRDAVPAKSVAAGGP